MNLKELRNQISKFKKRHPTMHLPKQMRQNVLDLLSDYPMNKLSDALSIPVANIKRWQEKLDGQGQISQEVAPVKHESRTLIKISDILKPVGKGKITPLKYEIKVLRDGSSTSLLLNDDHELTMFFKSLVDKSDKTIITRVEQ